MCSVHWRVGDSSEGGGKISERHKARPKAREKRKRGEGWDKNHHPSIHKCPQTQRHVTRTTRTLHTPRVASRGEVRGLPRRKFTAPWHSWTSAARWPWRRARGAGSGGRPHAGAAHCSRSPSAQGATAARSGWRQATRPDAPVTARGGASACGTLLQRRGCASGGARRGSSCWCQQTACGGQTWWWWQMRGMTWRRTRWRVMRRH